MTEALIGAIARELCASRLWNPDDQIGSTTFLDECMDQVREILSAIRTAPLSARVAFAREIAPDEWLPIESAPKDGTHILAYRALIGVRFTNLTNPPTVVHWFDDQDTPGFYTSVNEIAPERPFCPTHYRPLPAPPATKDETK